MYLYKTLPQDEHKVRIYTLQNGLTVYLAQNFDAPRIQSYIAVRAGSNQDPEDNTGLAHYLEHMMFKGNSHIGTKNWHQEKKLLNEIEILFEQHKATQSPEEKKQIYKKIDKLSAQASQYALANEYDKCLSLLGATGTNAHTWLDETVYKNNIPSHELEKFLKIESNRFSEIALRLFHTELETVYEEFNRAQDNDARLTHEALMNALFPTHPIGQQTTLGRAEHLKNPSMKAIHEFFKTYYVPNNMAMVLVGDLDFDETIQLIDQYFGKLPPRALPKRREIKEKPLQSVQKITVKSPSTPRVHIGWRSKGYGSDESIMLDIIANILSNQGECGLLDLHVNFAQKALFAQAYGAVHNDYGYFSAVAVPKENQTLDEVLHLVFEQIENIKQGNFPAWLLTAINNDFRVQRIKGTETADGLATNLYQTFIRKQSWEDELSELDRYAALTHQQIADFAKGFFKENYVIVYKEEGQNENLIRVEKPEITPIVLNTEETSAFFKDIASMETTETTPQFIDYQKSIQTAQVQGHPWSFVRNIHNDWAALHIIFPMGKDHNLRTALASQVLQYLGTDTLSPDELKLEFYKIGITYDIKISDDELKISISGLDSKLIQGIDLLWNWLHNVVPDEGIYREFLQTIEESRAVAKRDKNRIFHALKQYAQYGKNSRFRTVLSMEELHNISCHQLTEDIQQWTKYPFEVFYYGNQPEEIQQHLSRIFCQSTREIPNKKEFPEADTSGKVFFVDYEMVQAELFQVAKGRQTNLNTMGQVSLFNEYFGSGLSSIVFQEIRERKSLAYSAYVLQQTANRTEEHDYFSIYLGTQPDKLPLALSTVHELMSDFPTIDIQFESAKDSALKKLASGRITRTNIFFSHHRLKKLGILHDIRQKVYPEIEQSTLENLAEKYKQYFGELQFNTALMGKKQSIPWESLPLDTEVIELTLEEVFGF